MRATLAPEDLLAPVLGISEVSRLLGVSDRTVRAWCDRGDLPGFKLSSHPRARWHFRRADVLALVLGDQEANGDGSNG